MKMATNENICRSTSVHLKENHLLYEFILYYFGFRFKVFFIRIATVVAIAQILKNSGYVVEKNKNITAIITSTVDMKDESRGRPIQKAKRYYWGRQKRLMTSWLLLKRKRSLQTFSCFLFAVGICLVEVPFLLSPIGCLFKTGIVSSRTHNRFLLQTQAGSILRPVHWFVFRDFSDKNSSP